jgi:hypothetical protein
MDENQYGDLVSTHLGNKPVTQIRYMPAMEDRIIMMRAVLDEAAREIKPSTATQAQMAQAIVVKAAGGATREELKIAAIEVGKIPAA